MGERGIKPNVTCPYCRAQWFEQSEELLDLRSALSAAERERDARHELLVDIARDLDLLGRDLSSIPGAVRSALSAAREEANDADRVRALLGEILDAVCGALKPNTPPGVLPSYADLPDLARAAREEARREREQTDVWQSQLHDTAAALYLAKEEARRLRGALEAYQRANRLHNDSEAELFERARAALGSSPVGGDAATNVHNGSNEGGER